MSNSLREQLREHYNASQQVAIATVMSPGQAPFSLLQVRAKALPSCKIVFFFSFFFFFSML